MNSLDLCGPNPAPMSCVEVEALKRIILMLSKKPIVIQIGAYIGVSTMAILEANPATFIFSIDIKPYLEERENLLEANLSISQVVRVLGDSSDIGKYWPVKCDLLFIDGDHRYPAVKADIGTWVPKIKKGGKVLFHDYIPPPYPTRSRVQIAVDEAMDGYEEILFVDRLRGFKI